MVGVIAAILIAAKVSDSRNDVRAWTLVAAVAIGYMISRGLAKSGSKYAVLEERQRARGWRGRWRGRFRGSACARLPCSRTRTQSAGSNHDW
jgi:hypothetical protein